MTHDGAVAPSEAPTETAPIHLIDLPRDRVHRLSDVLKLLVTLVGIALVLLLGTYASGTTAGITADLQGFYGALHRLLVAPVNILEGAVTLILPAVVVLALALRREPRRVLEALGGLALGIIVALTCAETTRRWGVPELIQSLSITADGVSDVTMPAYLAGVAAMLTAAGRRRAFRPLAVSWGVLWAAVSIAAISGFVTLPAVLATVLIGRVAGLALRYVFGSPTDSAYGKHLIEGVRRAGFHPRGLIRVDPQGGFANDQLDTATVALGRTRQGRVYSLTTVDDHHLVVVALDGEQVAAGALAKFWRTVRVRGIDARPTMNLRHTAESTALLSYSARTAGVRSPRVLGMAQARDTMIIVYQRPSACRSFADLSPEEATDEVLDAIWAEVGKAHEAGITHRSLTSDTVLVCPEEGPNVPAVWLTSWEMGEVASGGISRKIDHIQLISMLAAKAGAARAVDSAFRALDEFEVGALAPLLQTILLPRSTRIETRARGRILHEVRAAILERLPDAPETSEKLARFSLRTVLSITLGIVAGYLVLTGFNGPEIVEAVSRASPWWALATFLLALVSAFGAALALIAFAPVKMPLWRTYEAQIASSFHAFTLPAGVGPALVNLTLLRRRKVAAPLAAATVGLVQVSAVVVTVTSLVVLSLATGSKGALVKLPSATVLIAIGLSVGVIALGLVFPRVRAWASSKVMPTIRQTWPRLVQVLGQPWRLGLGLFGNFLVAAAYVAAFNASLLAFGQHLPIVDVAVLYLIGNAAGALVPTPGGLGAVEIALGAGLTSAGVPGAVAASVVVLFRAITYWLRVLLGYFAMKHLQKVGEL